MDKHNELYNSLHLLIEEAVRTFRDKYIEGRYIVQSNMCLIVAKQFSNIR